MNMKRVGVLMAVVIAIAALVVGALYLIPGFRFAGYRPMAESCPEFLSTTPSIVLASSPTKADRTIRLEFTFLTGTSTVGDEYTLAWSFTKVSTGSIPPETVFESTKTTFKETINNKLSTVIDEAAVITKDLQGTYVVRVKVTIKSKSGKQCTTEFSHPIAVLPGI